MHTAPTGQRYWLKMHQITAFWHTFGISNGLTVPKEAVKLVTYVKGTPREVYQVSAEFMQEQLAHYIERLKSYGDGWSSDFEHPHGITTREAFLEDEAQHESRAAVLEMIELLQAYRIEDTLTDNAQLSKIDSLRDWERTLTPEEREAVRRSIGSIEKILIKKA